MVAASSPLPAAEISFEKHALFTSPPGCAPDAVTPDGHGIAFLEVDGNQMQTFWDGVGGKPFDGLGVMRDDSPSVFVSDDGAHVAYAGGRGDHYFVGRDGAEYPPFEAFSRSVPPVFSHAGRHLAYGAGTRDDICQLILDGQVVNTEPVAPFQAVFSPDGERLAFVEMLTASDERVDLRIVLDGEPGPSLDGMRNAGGALQFSPDSRRFAFHEIDEHGQSRWTLDGRPQRWATEVHPIGLAQLRGIGVIEPPLRARFSPDSRRFAYVANVSEKGAAMLEDDEPGPVFEAVGKPVFSPDSAHLAYVAQPKGKRLALVIDGTPGPEWVGENCGTPVFSPDSRHVALTIMRSEGGFLRKRRVYSCAIDRDVLAEFDADDAIEAPVFSPDGQRVAWWVRQGKDVRTLVNGAFAGGLTTAASAPTFSRSARLVYPAIMPDGRVAVSIDGRLGPLAMSLIQPASAAVVFGESAPDRPVLPFAISPDGEHVAWAGMFDESARPVIDDTLGPPFEILFDSGFDESGAAVWFAQSADTVYRVTGRLPSR